MGFWRLLFRTFFETFFGLLGPGPGRLFSRLFETFWLFFGPETPPRSTEPQLYAVSQCHPVLIKSRQPFSGIYHSIENDNLLKTLPCALIGRHLVGVWIGGVWNGHFPESEKYFSEAEFFRKIADIPKKRFSPNFRLRNLKIQSPKKCNSIPPAIPYPH